MSCEHCADVYESDETCAIFEPRAFRNTKAVLSFFVEAVDGRRWWLAMGAGRFGSDMAAVPVEYCPWCGRRLGDEGGGAE